MKSISLAFASVIFLPMLFTYPSIPNVNIRTLSGLPIIQKATSDYFSIDMPENWHVKKEGDNLTFGKEADADIGGCASPEQIMIPRSL